MSRTVVTVDEETPILKASIMIKEKKVGSLPVIDKGGKVIGIVTDGDLKSESPSKAKSLDVHELNYLLATVSVKKIMTKNVVFVGPD